MIDGGRVRAFLAVPPDPDWAESAGRLVRHLRPELPDASWTRPSSWHLTLRFLGEIPREKLSEFVSAIGAQAPGRAACALAAEGSVVFPPRGPARVLGIAFRRDAGSVSLADLAGDAERCARAVGLESETRPFRPHVTLARLRRPWPDPALGRFRAAADGWSFPPWPVRSCVLYESRLDPEGAVHTAVGRWELAAPQGVPA